MSSQPPTAACNADEWILSQNTDVNTSLQVKCLAPSDYVGLTVVAEAGLISLVALGYVLFRIGLNMAKIWKAGRRNVFAVFEEANDIFMFSLFIADILQAIGAVMDIRWIGLGKVFVGSYCTAQGVIQQLGETAVAFASLTIAAYTFFSIALNTGIEQRRIALAIASLTWIPVIILVMIGNLVPRADDRQFISPAPYWCWISRAHMPWRIGGEYFWFWFALLFSAVSHTLLFFWLRGNVVQDEVVWWKISFKRLKEDSPVFDITKETKRRRKAVVMLAYPVVYCITILPPSVVRWVAFVQEKNNNGLNTIPAAATFAAITIHDLSGLFNVFLLLTTRSGSTLFGGIQGPDVAKSDDDSITDDSRPTTPPGEVRDHEKGDISEAESTRRRRRPRADSVSVISHGSSEHPLP